MTTTLVKTEDGIDLDVDAVLNLPASPAVPVTNAIATQAPVVAQQGFEAMNCRDMLSERANAQLAARAPADFQAMYADDNVLGTFGNEAVAEINVLVDKLLGDIGRAANIPELTALTNQLDDTLRSFTSKYGGSAALKESRDHFEKSKEWVAKLFHRFRNELHMLLRDARGIQAFLDSLEGQLLEKQASLRENVERCNQLYATNEAALKKLVVAIALMEHVRDAAVAHMNSIVPAAGQAGRDDREERDRVAQFIQQLDVRVGEFKQRLFVAWATSPQVRNIRGISWGLAQRMGLLVNLTIPVFKLTVVQWAMAMEADQAAKTAQAVQATTEAAMSAWAEAAGQIVPAAAAAIQTPSMSPDVILQVAASLQTQAEGFVTAYRDGMAARQQVDAAIMKAAQVIAMSQDKAAATVRELIANGVTTNTTLDRPEPLELPAVVAELAPEALAA